MCTAWLGLGLGLGLRPGRLGSGRQQREAALLYLHLQLLLELLQLLLELGDARVAHVGILLPSADKLGILLLKDVLILQRAVVVSGLVVCVLLALEQLVVELRDRLASLLLVCLVA